MLPNCVSKMYAIAVLFISSKIQSPLFFWGHLFCLIMVLQILIILYYYYILHFPQYYICIKQYTLLFVIFTVWKTCSDLACMKYRIIIIYNIIVSVFKKKVPPVSPILLYKKTKNTNQNFECLLLYMFCCLLQKKLYVC